MNNAVLIPGAYVLGMHRSGTSLLAGVLDRLGLVGGRQELMFKADKFNSDGYWERVDVVEWHDRALRKQRGWASAPPPPVAFSDKRLGGLAAEIPDLLAPYQRPWMLKDPRQCLYLPVWQEARGDIDLHVISVRHPHEVQRSLERRNGYSPELGLALWERYVFDVLRSTRGRRALVVSYDALTTDPTTTVAEIAEVLSRTLLADTPPDDTAVGSAIDLIRAGRPPKPPQPMNPERQQLIDTLLDQVGYTSSLDCDTIALSGESRTVIDKRRRRLNTMGIAVRTNAVARGRLDRFRVRRR